MAEGRGGPPARRGLMTACGAYPFLGQRVGNNVSSLRTISPATKREISASWFSPQRDRSIPEGASAS